MKAKDYKLLEMAVENGVKFGYIQAHKYTENPSEEEVQHHIAEEVLNEICEWFDFDNPFNNQQ
jgi:hypothetical protein